MQHRTVHIKVQYSPKPEATIRNALLPLLQPNTESKYIVYTNTRSLAKRSFKSLQNFCDANDLQHIDIVEFTGDLEHDEKSNSIKHFLDISNTENYNPRVLTATSGAANCGIDSSKIEGVFKIGFPSSVEELNQEQGRAGRRQATDSVTDFYTMFIYLESFLYLFERIHEKPQQTDEPTQSEDNPFFGKKRKQYIDEQKSNLLDVGRLLCLPTECYHVALKKKSANPFLAPGQASPPCEHFCSFCTGSITNIDWERAEEVLRRWCHHGSQCLMLWLETSIEPKITSSLR